MSEPFICNPVNLSKIEEMRSPRTLFIPISAGENPSMEEMRELCENSIDTGWRGGEISVHPGNGGVTCVIPKNKGPLKLTGDFETYYADCERELAPGRENSDAPDGDRCSTGGIFRGLHRISLALKGKDGC